MALRTPQGGQPLRPRQPSLPDGAISCRATNPLALNEDVGRVFLDERQAKATTATRLFRNRELFTALRRFAMPAYFDGAAGRAKREFALWSAGCSSGEEVYSLAMVAFDELARRRLPPKAQCFGTDINPQRIAEGRAGLYGRPTESAFDREYWQLLRNYAMIDGGNVQMGDALRAACRFGLFDIRKRPKNHTFDFIVCNHVLQYYDYEGQQVILGNLSSVLRPGGMLYLEGITADAVAGAGLEKMGAPYLFKPSR